MRCGGSCTRRRCASNGCSTSLNTSTTSPGGRGREQRGWQACCSAPPPLHLPSAAPHPLHLRLRALLPGPPQRRCCGGTATCAAAPPLLAPAAAAAAHDAHKQIDRREAPTPQAKLLHPQEERPLCSTRREPAAAWKRSSAPAGSRAESCEKWRQPSGGGATWSLCRTNRAALAASVACSALQCCCTQASLSKAADTSHTKI